MSIYFPMLEMFSATISLNIFSCPFFLMGGIGACPWWLKLGLVPLVIRALSRGVFRGACELIMTLDSLSADTWGCVPTLLVGWPEMSHPWSLEAVGVRS